MAGTTVLMAPMGLMMIHNPMTVAMGSKAEMEKAISMLEEVKESIVNAYELKTGLSRAKLSRLMDCETWMNAKRAIELGFADGMMGNSAVTDDLPAFEFSDRMVEMALVNKITAKTRTDPETRQEPKEESAPKHGRSVDDLMERLNLLNN